VTTREKSVRTLRKSKRGSKIYRHGGKSLTLNQWAERLGTTWNALYQRLSAGWSLTRTLNQPVRYRRS